MEKIVEISLEDMSDQEDAMVGKPVAITERKHSLDESSKLRLQLEALSDDIDDFIEENSIHDIDRSLSDLDFVIKRMEEMRSLYRSRYKEISALLRVLGVLETSFDDNDIEDEDVFANRVTTMNLFIYLFSLYFTSHKKSKTMLPKQVY